MMRSPRLHSEGVRYRIEVLSRVESSSTGICCHRVDLGRRLLYSREVNCRCCHRVDLGRRLLDSREVNCRPEGWCPHIKLAACAIARRRRPYGGLFLCWQYFMPIPFIILTQLFTARGIPCALCVYLVLQHGVSVSVPYYWYTEVLTCSTLFISRSGLIINFFPLF